MQPTTVGLCSATLTIIIIVSRSAVLSALETGYVRGTEDDDAGRLKDLKCAYLFSGLTYMRLTKLMLEDQNICTSIAAGMVYTGYNSKTIICTLYDNDSDEVKIGSLWILHLYIHTMPNYHEKVLMNQQDQRARSQAIDNLIGTHSYVIEQLQKDSARCRQGNTFDTYRDWHAVHVMQTSPGGKPGLDELQGAILRNYFGTEKMLKTNNAQSTFGRRCDALKSRQLFMNNLGVDNEAKSNLMYAYNVQVNWHHTHVYLDYSWTYAHKLLWHKNSLKNVKRYYNMHIGLLKVIMCRLTWKHLLYVKDYTGTNRVKYLRKWYDLLIDFETMLRIDGDPHIKYLTTAMYTLAKARDSIVNIIYNLEEILHDITSWLECEATNPMTLDGREFVQDCMSKEQFSITKHYLKTSSRIPIERNSLVIAKTFLCYLNVIFKNVDFDVIRSLTDYIDEINR
ncbi:uncharacterized protein LOC126843601 [Adelges cooleyi]|uniref:uncharacterized protein LOC126843601 n=1 Tax=Adelges cooleyi TaxID=133065 RepID=UPI002180225B|nr:uncharacterized protein LOC126843601 [Adelges cooleyi]